MPKTVSDIVRELAGEKGISQADIAKSAGVTRSAVSKWFSGTSQPSREVLPRLCVLFGVPISRFYISDIPDRLLVDEPQEHWHGQEPLYDVAAGPGRSNEDMPGEYIDDAFHDEDYSYARVHGDSMLPILQDGDVVKVHHQTETRPEDFTVVKVDGEHATVKHVEIADNGVWLRAENKNVFPDKFYTIQDVMTLPITIIGKAVEVRRAL